MSRIEEYPVLQVALDFTSLEEALLTALKAWENGAAILEAGTPLIKSVGMLAVRMLRRVFPETVILADMKTFDTGALETGLAGSNGADITTVMGLADDATIAAAAEEAHRRGMMLEADLMGHPDPVARAGELRDLGVDIVGIHVGIDVQRRRSLTAAEKADLIARVKEAFKGPVAVAGGLNQDTVEDVLRAGADIVVVGSAITRAPDPGEATRRIAVLVEKYR